MRNSRDFKNTYRLIFPKQLILTCIYIIIKFLRRTLPSKFYERIKVIGKTKFISIYNFILNPANQNGIGNFGIDLGNLRAETNGIDLGNLRAETIRYPKVTSFKKNMSSVSIIVATLGNRNSLVDALQSILLASNNLEIEVVIVTPKESISKVQDLVFELPSHTREIKYSFVEDTKEGIYPAMNLGINASTKEYVMFLNDDDALVPNSLDYVNDELENEKPIDLICGISHYEYKCCGSIISTYPEKIFGSRIMHGAMSSSHQAQIWNRNTLLGLGGFRYLFKKRYSFKNGYYAIELANDFDLFVRAFERNISYMSVDVSIAIMDPAGVSIASWKKTYRELLAIKWHVTTLDLKWLFKLPLLIFSIETYHRNSVWLHEHK